MSTSPVIEWRNATTPFAVVTSLALTGAGVAGAIPVGTSSNVASIYLYNNFVGAGSIADATNCVLASYDDTVHQGFATTLAVSGLYLAVQVVDYNGVTTGADGFFYQIGGLTKHAIGTNSGVIGGSTASRVNINMKVIIPQSATQGSFSQGLWLEYNSTA